MHFSTHQHRIGISKTKNRIVCYSKGMFWPNIRAIIPTYSVISLNILRYPNFDLGKHNVLPDRTSVLWNKYRPI